MTQDACFVRRNKESIHSGHFMVSDFDDNDSEEVVRESDDVDAINEQLVSDVEHHHGQSLRPCEQQAKGPETTTSDFHGEEGFDFQSACKETYDTYKFGPRSSQAISIDASLSKLFQCMTLAYNGKLTSPRWKHFKGLKLKWKEKIRLNNVIWRAWHMQFIVKKKPVVCQFATPIDNEVHSKPEAVVLEGKYWKRKMENVVAEYKNWRRYHKNRLNTMCPSKLLDLDFFKWPNRSLNRNPSTPPATLGMIIDDDPFMDVSDTLFSSISQSFVRQNSRELSYGCGLADFIQPGLAQLQPNLDDFMDTFDQLHDSVSLKTLLQDYIDPVQPATQFNQVDSFITGKVPNDLPSNLPPIPNVLNSTTGAAPNQVFAAESNLQPFKLPTSSPQSNFMSSSEFQSLPTCHNTITAASSVFNNGYSANSKLGAFNLNESSSEFVSNFLSHPSTNLSNMVQSDSPVQVLQSGCSVANSIHTVSFSDENCNASSHNQSPSIANANNVMQRSCSPANECNIIHSPPQVSSLLTGADMQNRRFKTPAINCNVVPSQSETMFLPLDSSSNIYSNTIPSTSSSDLLFTPPKMTAPQTKIKRTSTSSSSKSTALRRSSHPVCMRNSRSRSCVSIAPNTGQTTATVSEPSSRKISVIATTNGSSPSFLPQRPVFAQVLPTAYSNVNSIASSPLSEPPVTIINTLTSTEAKSDNILKATPSSSPFAPTVIFSPVALASMTGVTDFQSRVLVGAANQVFNTNVNQQGTQTTNAKLPIPPLAAIPKVSSSASHMNSYNSVSILTNTKSRNAKSPVDQANYKEQRRIVHINAEQTRRFNIKYGFSVIQNLVPSLNKNTNAKVSKAQMLQKAADYIRHMKNEKTEMARENERIKKEIEALNDDINALQAQLPLTGAPIASSNTHVMADMFEEYVRNNTLQNWKFWIFSLIIRPLFEKYDQFVHTNSIEEFCRSVLSWLDQYCSLIYFRPAVSNSLRHLSTTTDILSNPSSVKDEAEKAVSQGARNKPR